MEDIKEALVIFSVIIWLAIPALWIPIAVIAIWFPEIAGMLPIIKIAMTHALFFICSLIAMGVSEVIDEDDN